MLKLQKLKIMNMGRFVEEQELDFSILGSLTQIDGKNNNTNGSSGSGKSTVFNAIEFLLGLNDIPVSTLQSRLTKEPITVSGTFLWNNTEIEIVRSKKGLKIVLPEEIIEGSSKLTEERLDQIIGMPRDLFRKTIIKRQREGGFFLDFTPKETYQFLTDCLGLSYLNKKEEIVSKKIKELIEKRISLENSKNSKLSALDATLFGIKNIGTGPIKEIDQSTILELKSKSEQSKSTLSVLQNMHSTQLLELEKERPNIVSETFDRTLWDNLLSKQKSIESQISQILSSEKDRQTTVRSNISAINSELQKLNYKILDSEKSKQEAVSNANQIKKIRLSICPTCDQGWVTETAKAKESELLIKMKDLKAKIDDGELAKSQVVEFQNTLNDLTNSLVPIVDPKIPILNEDLKSVQQQILEQKSLSDEFVLSVNTKNKLLLSQFKQKYDELVSKQRSESQLLLGQKEMDENIFKNALYAFKTYEELKKTYDTTLLGLKHKEQEYVSSINAIDLDLQDIVKETEIAEEIKRALKLFTSISFDDTLEDISDNATKLIRGIPNMANATIQLEGTKETKEGKIKEEVNAVISMDGEIGVPIKSLSGGERSSVDLAVDLAVIDVIESRTGLGSNIFVLDEPFIGMDAVSIEMVIEMLTNLNINKSLIIVDHNDIIKQMMTNKIIVERTGQHSKIMVG